MTIESVSWDNRKDEFTIVTDLHAWHFPFARLRVPPSATNRVVEATPDPELGCEAFTYRLESGAEDSVHMDAVRAFNRDPDMIQQLIMHRLTAAVRDAIQESTLGRRQLARYLGTSPTQLYRLLDPDYPGKSIGQMVSLLNMLGKEVDVVISDEQTTQPGKRPSRSETTNKKGQPSRD